MVRFVGHRANYVRIRPDGSYDFYYQHWLASFQEHTAWTDGVIRFAIGPIAQILAERKAWMLKYSLKNNGAEAAKRDAQAFRNAGREVIELTAHFESPVRPLAFDREALWAEAVQRSMRVLDRGIAFSA